MAKKEPHREACRDRQVRPAAASLPDGSSETVSSGGRGGRDHVTHEVIPAGFEFPPELADAARR